MGRVMFLTVPWSGPPGGGVSRKSTIKMPAEKSVVARLSTVTGCCGFSAFFGGAFVFFFDTFFNDLACWLLG